MVQDAKVTEWIERYENLRSYIEIHLEDTDDGGSSRRAADLESAQWWIRDEYAELTELAADLIGGGW